MDDAQIWAMIGAFTTLMLGTLTVVTTTFVRVLRSELGGMRTELNTQIGGMRNELNAQIGGVRNELDAQIGGMRNELNAQIGGLRGEMNGRFDAVNTRIDALDRDVQALVKRTFGLDRE